MFMTYNLYNMFNVIRYIKKTRNLKERESGVAINESIHQLHKLSHVMFKFSLIKKVR